MDRERVIIGDILRPRGVRGEVVVRSQTDVPGRFEELKSAWVRFVKGPLAGSDREIVIDEAWPHKGDWVLKFAGVDSMNDAESFKGAEIWVPFVERGTLPDGKYFEMDLVGCAVVELGSSRKLGLVERLQGYGGPSLLELTIDGREVLIPFTPDICREVSLETRTIVVDLPEGLLELSA